MTVRHYRYAGLWVESELALPEWAAFESQQPPGGADVLIRLNPAREQDGPAPAVEPGAYAFNILETAHYQVMSGREISITPTSDAGEREMRLFLLGSAWGALCYQRGLLALHASVIQIDGQVVAFCGPSGSGKSTLAASLIQHGGRLVSDDLCCIEIGADEARVYPSAPRLKLWRTALKRLGLESAAMEQDHFRLDKFHLAHKQAAPSGAPLSLNAVYLLKWGDPGLARLRGLQAVSRLVSAATYHPELLEPLDCTRAHWQRCLQLARLAPIWELSRPQDWSDVGWPFRLPQG